MVKKDLKLVNNDAEAQHAICFKAQVKDQNVKNNNGIVIGSL